MKIITTVGTSIFTNLIKDGQNDDIKNKYETLKDCRFSEWADYKTTIEDHKGKGGRKGLRSLVETAIGDNSNVSAEIESILKIAKNEIVEVHLLATDTILSVLAAEIIKKWFDNQELAIVQFNADYKNDVIKNLQVAELSDFKIGLNNLIIRFYQIVGEHFNPKNYVLNITGGYKALIPYLTILGQITKIDIRYKFEDTKGLIEIPRLPLTINYELFEQYFTIFQNLEEVVNSKKMGDEKVNYLKTHDAKHYVFTEDKNAESCLEFLNDGKEFTLNALGMIFWSNYKKQFFIFYCSDTVFSEIGKQEEIKRILATKFCYRNQRRSKNRAEQDHITVFKDGNNNNRIYYFEDSISTYIYKTFENHSDHERFLKTKFSEKIKNEIKSESTIRKIKIENV